MRVSFVIAGLAVAAFLGFLLAGDRGESLNARSSQNGISRLVPAAATVTPEEQIICRGGYEPPLCLARKFDKSQDLIFPGNGSAQPAVAKDTKPGHVGIHQAAYINDGMYGPGASWVSNSPDSWIKIDLGKATAINTIAFGRDRLGEFNDGNPGQFVISVALSDDVYANGNSSNDSVEYTTVYDSEEVGFSGVVSRAETVKAQFQPLVARYIKITFENEGTAIDEVEVFMLQPPPPGTSVTKKSGSESPSKTRTPLPTRTTIPTSTRTPVPTFTPVPTDTQTPVPTDTPIPTDTPTPRPTNTPLPTDTDTPVPIPTDTPIPMDTPIPTLTDWLEWTLVPVEPWSYVPDP